MNRMDMPTGGSSSESTMDVRRYLTALSRSRPLIALIVAGITGTVLVLSLILPKTYESTATIVLIVDSSGLDTPDPVTVQRQLATFDALINSGDVAGSAAEQLPGETEESVDSAIESTVDDEANLISITASDGEPERARQIAAAVADTFLEAQTSLERESLDAQEAALEEELRRLERDPAAAPEDVALIRQQLSNVRLQGLNAGSELQLAEAPETPDAQASPRPLRNTILALFASLFIAVLVALARDQLRPRITQPRELSRLMELPVLAGVPYVRARRRLGRRRRRDIASAIEYEAYQNLSAAVQLGLPPGRNGHVILVTSAVHSEGKTTVTARLGRALAHAGHRTLLVSADLQVPDLHEIFNLPLRPGLSDVLALVDRVGGVSDRVLPATAHGIPIGGMSSDREPPLEVLTSGTTDRDPARLLSGGALHRFISYVRSLGYDYILLDAPPMLGIADVQPLANEADHVILVARLDRLTPDNVIDAKELLDRLDVQQLGLVVLGARAEASPYYGERPPIFSGQEQREGTAQSGWSSRA